MPETGKLYDRNSCFIAAAVNPRLLHQYFQVSSLPQILQIF